MIDATVRGVLVVWGGIEDWPWRAGGLAPLRRTGSSTGPQQSAAILGGAACTFAVALRDLCAVKAPRPLAARGRDPRGRVPAAGLEISRAIAEAHGGRIFLGDTARAGMSEGFGQPVAA
jgi:hypothetical protein